MGNFITTSEVNTMLNYTTSTYESRIQDWLPYLPGRVCAIANNYFKSKQAYVNGSDFLFSASSAVIRTTGEDFIDDGHFQAGDDIYVKGTLRNDGFYVISTVTTTVITIDTSSEYSVVSITDEDIDDEDLDDVYIWFVRFPRELKPIVANMIRYDMLERLSKKGISQERIGNYSVSYQRAADIGYNYPDDVIGGLDQFVIPAVF